MEIATPPQNSRFIRRRVLFGAIVTMLVIVNCGLALLVRHLRPWKMLQTTAVELAKQPQNPFASLLVFESPKEPDKITIVRPGDAKVETLPGHWGYRFLSSHIIAAYGTTIDNQNQQHLLLLSPTKNLEKNIADLPGKIISIRSDKKATYLLVTGIDQKASTATTTTLYTCLMPTLPAKSICKKLPQAVHGMPAPSASDQYVMVWVPNDENKLLIANQASSTQIFTLNSATFQATMVTNTAAVAPARDVFEPHEHYAISRFFGLTTIYNNTRHKRSYFFLPSKSTLSWWAPDTLLITDAGHLSVLNITTREKSDLISFDEQPSVTASFFEQGL